MQYVIKKVDGNGSTENPTSIKYWDGKRWINDNGAAKTKVYKSRKAAEKVLVRERQLTRQTIMIQGF